MARELSVAVDLIIRRLGTLAGERDTGSDSPNPKSILINVPVGSRARAITVLEALAKGETELAEGARLVLNAATALWMEMEGRSKVESQNTGSKEANELHAA